MAAPGPGRSSRSVERQRLIDACISALHIHGPSRTTVERVAAIADLAPGTVRFCFRSKAAMLVASLEYLAGEFEQQVLLPVSQLRHEPGPALELLVDLYLDPRIASARKVSVWYSFWGEAGSRQEYHDIRGRKDEEFSALLHELVERLIVRTGAAHLDADAIALGLMGILEMMWQTFAFQSESGIDRAVARRRSLSYLRSVFPGQFGAAAATPQDAAQREPRPGHAAAVPQSDVPVLHAAVPAAAPSTAPSTAPIAPAHPSGPSGARLPAWAYAHGALLVAERERLLRPAWQFIGHQAEAPAAGDFLNGDLAGERVLVVRDERGRLRAFRNACRRRPHALVIARCGHLDGAIHCVSHGLTYRLDGRWVDGDPPGDLSALELKLLGALILVRAAAVTTTSAPANAAAANAAAATPTASGLTTASEPDWGAFDRLRPSGMQQIEVAADWKLIVERWLETPDSQRQFLPPNQLIEVRRDAALILQVIPLSAGRCRLQRFDYLAAPAKRRSAGARGTLEQWQRQVNSWLQQESGLAESTQIGLAGASDEMESSAPIAAPLAQFRRSITELLPAIPTLPERPL